MNKAQQYILTILRLGVGWFFFYAGFTKVIDPSWSAAGYLGSASTFPKLFEWLALAGNIEWVSFLNEWGLLFIGVGLILGLFVRYASYAGILLMLSYWLVALDFPMAGRAFLVDEHIIYTLVFGILILFQAGKYFGLDKYVKK